MGIDLDGTSDLHRYTSCVRPSPLATEFSTLQSNRPSPESHSWHAHGHAQSGAGLEQQQKEKHSLPSLSLPSMSMNTSPSMSAHNPLVPSTSANTPRLQKPSYLSSALYPTSRPGSPLVDLSGRSSIYGQSVVNSPQQCTSIPDDSSASFHLRSMGVRDARVKKSSPRYKHAQIPRHQQHFNTYAEGHRQSPSITSSFDSEPSLADGRLDNRKAGKERNAREDIRTQMEKHYRELLDAGPEYQPVTRLNKHNSDVARIPCKKEEVLDLSYKLHQERRKEIRGLRSALQQLVSRMEQYGDTEDLADVLASVKPFLRNSEANPSQKLTQSGYYAPHTPEATPSPDPNLCYPSNVLNHYE